MVWQESRAIPLPKCQISTLKSTKANWRDGIAFNGAVMARAGLRVVPARGGWVSTLITGEELGVGEILVRFKVLARESLLLLGARGGIMDSLRDDLERNQSKMNDTKPARVHDFAQATVQEFRFLVEALRHCDRAKLDGYVVAPDGEVIEVKKGKRRGVGGKGWVRCGG